MIDSWLKAVNDGKLTGCVMVDFRKAFDLVDHKILLNKLKCYKWDEIVYHGLNHTYLIELNAFL